MVSITPDSNPQKQQGIENVDIILPSVESVDIISPSIVEENKAVGVHLIGS